MAGTTFVLLYIRNQPYFGEVPNNVSSVFVDFGKDVEDKWLNVKVKCFVVEE